MYRETSEWSTPEYLYSFKFRRCDCRIYILPSVHPDDEDDEKERREKRCCGGGGETFRLDMGKREKDTAQDSCWFLVSGNFGKFQDLTCQDMQHDEPGMMLCETTFVSSRPHS